MQKDFDKIRPYNDAEAPAAIDRIIHDGTFTQFVKDFFKTKNLPTYIDQLRMVRSVTDFQRFVIFPLTTKLIHKTVKEFTVKGLEGLDIDKKYLFISNHRDIILDSTFVNNALLRNEFDTTEIAIGSNLLIKPWIVDLVKLNKTFIVDRSSSVRQALQSAKMLSHYIRHIITENKNSVWLAQREGRTKDGNDATQLSLLKMLNLSGTENTTKNFSELNIVPVSISYEFEPCDVYKVHELYLMKSEDGYKKTPEDDLKSMFTGIITDKGRIVLQFGEPINEHIEEINDTSNRIGVLEKIVQLIDNQILTNFWLWPNNYIAFDILNGQNTYKRKYTKQEKDIFLTYLQQKLNKITIEKEEAEHLLLGIYSNPVINKIKNKLL